MAESDGEVEREVRELLAGWRQRRRSGHEPCARHNVSACLAALQEELSLLNMKYVFNPYTEMVSGMEGGDTLRCGALVSLVNAAWSLLQHHKALLDNHEKLTHENHTLHTNNNYLNGKVETLSAEVTRREREARACVSEGARAAEHATSASSELRTARARLALLTRQRAASEHALRVEIKKLERRNQQLQDMLRDKCGTFLSTGDARDGTAEEFRAREKRYKDTINKLQVNNRQLIEQVVALKDELLVNSVTNTSIQDTL